MLVYTAHITPRIEYILQYFNEKLLIDAQLTNDVELYRSSDEAKINYSPDRVDATELFIHPSGLLHQHSIKKQKLECFEWNGLKAFFKTDDDFGFDLFSAVFYLITRYEEYLEHEPDEYGRYAHWNSLAWNEEFLNKPIIDIWLLKFAEVLQQKFSSFTTCLPVGKVHHSPFTFLPTYDIDIAWSYQNKGFWRNLAASVNKPLSIPERLKVVLGNKKDPYDSYDWLVQLHQQYALQPLYFFLVAAENSEYDKNISPKKKALQQLTMETAKHGIIGLHPSTQSNTNKELLVKEKNTLQLISNKLVTATRHHYIQFYLPHSYRELIAAGFTDDYSMGYGTVNGFRASTSHSFLWYDFEKEESTSLRIHPFAYMEANSFYELHQSAAEALEEAKQLVEEVKNVNGTFISIFHNHFLGTDKMFKGWREMYEELLTEINFAKVSE